ncbi:nucleolar pre-ribosomal-associated protein 1 isoform X4 [Salminus brasiliensis]|uniref:nucleolar pre-ribosomal-associated protein 1 isoform X4 n=1 Tax=Salminus brasiliensis TaxID=930266 RepID=UPI003B833E3A
MAYKRQNTDQLESLRSAKKTIESEFNGTTFKSMLRDPGNAFKGLENFVRTAKKLPCASVYDVVEGYIKISAECSEILSLLEGDKQSVTEMMLIFQSLELILLRTASDLSHFSMVGTTIVKKLVSTHAKLLQSSLHSVNHPFVRQCLTLLAAMVSQGANSAREVFCSLVFSKPLNSLARHRDKSGRPDVRMAYVQFAVSFLLCGDGSLVGQMLDTKDFLSEILNTGLKEDRISVVSLILSTLQTKVVHNPAISKSKKVRFFSASTLAQIASLYKWNGIVDTLTVHSQEGGKLLVRELVHNFLLDLCCSHKHGISFHDPSLGTAMRAGNIVLLQFVVGLKQATEDELVSELLVSILKSSPDILPRYFRETHLSFTPRMKGAWLDSVALLKKIYQAQPEVSQAFQLQETVSAHNLLSMVLVTSLPPVCNKTFFTQGFKLPSMMGQHATVSMLAFILRRAQRNMENRLDAYSPTTMEEFVLLYREALSKILPDVMSIVSIWQSLSKKKEGDANTSATELKVGKEVKTEDYDEQNSKEVLFKALLLQVLCLYQRVVPHLISQSRFDFSKLLKGIVSERGMENDIPPFLQCEILKLALELPASSFSWFRLQDVANSELIQGEGSVFHLLLKIFISTRSSQLRTLTRMLILKVLRDCSVFEHTSRELELWVDHLLSSEPLQQEQVIQFLDQVLMRVMCNPYIYLEKVAAMLQEAVCLQTEMSGQDQKGCNLPVSHISDRQSSFAVIEESETSLKGTFLIDDILQTFPFSAIVPAVLEARNKLLLNFRDENDVVCEYICAVLCHILHYQRDPLTLCLTLKHYDDELFSSENSRVPHSSLMLFCVYYSKWLPQQPQETQFSLTRPTAAPTALDFSSFLKTCYSEGHQAFVQDSFRPALEKYLSSLQLSQFTGAVNQVLLYLRSIVDAFSSLSRSHAAEMVNCLLEVLGALVLKLYNTAETQINQPEAQEPDEVSIEMNHAAAQEVSKEQILLVVFRSVFKHPVLEQWFLAVELDVVPPHSLEQDCVRHLGAQLTECILNLLQSSAEKIRALHALEVISSYLSASQQALLKELHHSTRWHLADCLTEKLTSTSEELHWRTSLLSAAFHWLSTTYKELKKPEVKKEEVMLRRLKTLLISPESVRASDWNIFVKCGLKYRYQDKEFLATLNTLMKRMYRNVNASKGLLAIETLYVMITSHSLFMPTILASHIEADSSTECKEALVSLLLTLVRKCPEVCNRSHLPVLFGAYGATLSLADQKLLLLLNEYEKKNIDQIEFQCLLWGPAAVEYHKARKQLGTSLWQHPSSEQLLAQLAPDKMLNTVTHFPLHRCLMPQEGEELIYITETEDMPNQLCLYDPSFLFPLFSFILRPESVIDCQKFVTCHALGVTIVALSSHDLKMRSAAFHVLSSFYEHLEGARFRDKKQLLYLLDSVRNGIQKHNLRISFVHTTYIAKVAQQILRPEEHMYLVINKFLLGTPYVGLSRVPDFFKLFYSFDLEHKLERQWMLSVLEEGMMDRLSFDLCEQQNIYHALLGFCSSPLCDQPLQIQIVNILKRSVRITKAAYDLTKVHGVLTWIIQLIEKRCLDARLLSAVIGLLHSLWFTNLGQKESVVQCSKAADFYADGSVRCFTFPVINDFLCALLSVIRHLRIVVEAKEVQSFLQTLASVLRSHKMALGAHKDAGWLTVHPHSLSCSSALSLLYCWGTLVYDQALLFVLQDLANTHNIRGLYEAGKEGVQVNASSKLSQSSLEHLNEVADSGMEDFKPLLLNVLTYWEPLPVLTSSNLCNDDIPVSICLICGTAHTLIKWTLKALLERPNESKTCATVNWLHRVILSHKTIAKSLITDEAVKVDLLRLYHHTCECRMQEKSTSKLDTLELFTTIMVYLLEAQGIPNVLQTSEMKAYLETPSVEVTKKEAGLKLLSLYIHEVWNGGKVPQLLLTHAQLVTKDKKESEESSRTPVIHICEDILSAVDFVLKT